MDTANSSICSPFYNLAQLSFRFPWSDPEWKMINLREVSNLMISSKWVCFKVEMFVKLQRNFRIYSMHCRKAFQIFQIKRRRYFNCQILSPISFPAPTRDYLLFAGSMWGVHGHSRWSPSTEPRGSEGWGVRDSVIKSWCPKDFSE